jgi:hypothetical protein
MRGSVSRTFAAEALAGFSEEELSALDAMLQRVHRNIEG